MITNEFEYELEDETEYESSGMVPGPLRIQVVYDRSGAGSREFEYEDEFEDEFEYEGEFFDPVPTPRGATLLTRFAFGSANLTAKHGPIIRQLADELLRRWPKQWGFCLDVGIVGHEDEIGEPARYFALGRQRAEAVVAALLKELKRRVARIPAASRPKGKVLFAVSTAGPTRPMRSNVTAEGRALNRRVEVLLSRPHTCPDVV